MKEGRGEEGRQYGTAEERKRRMEKGGTKEEREMAEEMDK